MLTGSVAGAAAVGVLASQVSEAASPSRSTRPLPVTHDPVLHAVRRLTFGATPQLVAHVRKVGVSAWVDEQLSGATDVGATLHGTGLSSVPLPPAVSGPVMNELGHYGITDLQVQTFARAAFGDNQVYELMVELWTNHLSIYGAPFPQHKVVDDYTVIRKHALGAFADMLAASAQSPAMLLYLDQAYSRGNNPNENYARELLELHTVGVKGGYHQRDVHNAALALTGLSVDETTGRFTYQASWHHVGPVRVMGWSHPNRDQRNGKAVALSLVSYLAHHPMTANRIATKLVRRLVSDAPPAGLIASSAAVYRAHGTQIVPVIKHIVGSREFQRSAGQKSQRPFEWFVQCVRALGLQASPDLTTNGASIVYALRQLGQAPFEWSPPNGYPDSTSAYASTATMLARWNTVQTLVRGGYHGLQHVDATALVGAPVPSTVGGLVDRLSQVLLNGTPRADLKRAALTGVGLKASHVIDASAAHGLALPVAALLLSSPEALVR
ncbi:MAG: hypothetical protein QOG99_3287 [Frankiales bacterium]|jgi:uncharacterized protein (DUF1800 family)|nr:hypothetical protein [Frankiales bacterium]